MSEAVRMIDVSLHNLRTAIEIDRKEMALQLLDEVRIQIGIFKEEAEITAENIGKMVCSTWEITWEELTQRSRKKEYRFPRQVFMYLVRKYVPTMNLEEIGKIAGGYNHATVIHSVRVVEGEIAYNKGVRKVLAPLLRSVKAMLDDPVPCELEPAVVN